MDVITKRVLASGLIIGVALVTPACGDGDDRSAQAVEWGISRPLDARRVKLVSSVESCGEKSTPRLGRPVIRYSGRRVFIKLVLEPQEKSDGEGCLPELLGLTKTITLKRNLDELVLLDASTSPPERRWPR